MEWFVAKKRAEPRRRSPQATERQRATTQLAVARNRIVKLTVDFADR
jgi:hypothetical protein